MTENISAKKAESLFTAEAVFISGAESPDGFPPGHFPEIGFIGRSNVGKSSLINALTGKKIARTSNTPGRTQEILFFRIGGRFNLVDMPGYGYAKADKKKIRAWTELIDFFLSERRTLKRLCLLIDARHGFLPADFEFIEKLATFAVPYVVVLTKTDKLTQKELTGCRMGVEAAMKKQGGAWPAAFTVSAEKKQGLDDLRLFLARSAL